MHLKTMTTRMPLPFSDVFWYLTPNSRGGRQNVRRTAKILAVIFLLVLGMFLVFMFYTVPKKTSCHKPVVRREWRTLSPAEQLEYIGAVSCLMRQPSIIHLQASLYDDFVYTHTKAGSYSHYAAAFLAWHRLFIHTYESALRKKCAFSAELPYVELDAIVGV